MGLLLTNILLLFVSCSNELGQTPNSPTTKTTERTLDEIIAIAEKAPSIFAANDATRGGYQATKKVDISSIRALNISDGTTRTQSEESSLYAINYQDNDGYVLISTNTNTPGVIAYIDEGQYDLNEINDNNTDIGYVTDMANNYISNLPPIDKFVPIDKPDTVTFKIHPFLTTKWGQRDPEGIYCPNGISGCAATAMAQLFAFYEYPTTIALTYSDADKSQETLNWTDIKNHTVRHTIPGSSSHVFCMASTESHQTIGRLCRQLGELLESTYKSNSTSTDPLAVLSVAEQLGFTLESSHWKTYNDTCTLAPLGKAHPLFIIGYREDGAGHIWLVDGSIDMRITKVLQLVDQETKIVRERQIYNHVNWGWDGKSNGYILSSIFDTSKLYQADHSIYGSVGSNSNFKNGLRYAEVYTTLPPFVIH